MKHYIRLAFILTLIQLLAGFTFATTPAEVQSALDTRYKITTRSFLTGHIEQIGTILVLQKEGLRADVPKALMKPTIIKNREIDTVGGGSILIGNSGHALKVGDRLYLYKISAEDDNIMLIIATVETFDTVHKGSTKTEPYKTSLRFRYDGGLSSVTTEQVLKDISAWFLTEQEASTASTKTVQLGQTLDEVTGILGAPSKKIDLGAKVVFVYKDMKVIFVDGKVADVQ